MRRRETDPNPEAPPETEEPTASAVMKPGSWNEEKRTIDVVLSAGATVRWRNFWGEEWDEELVVADGSVDTARLDAGAPFLIQHRDRDHNALLGSFVRGSSRVEGSELIATVQFTPKDLAEARGVEPFIQEIGLGFRANVSVGYRPLEQQIIERAGAPMLVRVTRWEPLEGSSVNVPADNDAGYRARSTERRLMPPTKPANPPTEPSDLTPEQRAAEGRRVDTIIALAKKRGLGPDHALVVTAIRTGQELDGDKGFRAALIEHDVVGSEGTRVDPTHRAEPGVDEETKIIDAMATAIAHRADPRNVKLEGDAGDFRHMTLAAMGRELMRRRNESDRSLADIDVAQRMCVPVPARRQGYHTSSDFTSLLSNVASKMVAVNARTAPRTYERAAQRRTLNDFKTAAIIVLPNLPDLDKNTSDAQQVKYTTFSEEGTQWRGYRYTSGFAVGPEAIVNDDQEVLAMWPGKATVAAYRTRNGTFWTEFLAKVFGATAYFDAAHGNLAGTGLVPSAAGIDSLEQLAAAQTDADGNIIDVPLSLIFCGPATRLALGQLLDRTNRDSDSAQNLPTGQDYELIFERRLTGTPYFAAAPIGENGLLYGTVRGYEEPRVRVKTDFQTGGVQMVIEDSFASAVYDFRGVYKQPGA